MTNTRIFCVLYHPACGGVIPVSPSPHASQKRDCVMGPPPPPPPDGPGGRGGGGGGTGKSSHVEWRRD